jgi:hypothetical protein
MDDLSASQLFYGILDRELAQAIAAMQQQEGEHRILNAITDVRHDLDHSRQSTSSVWEPEWPNRQGPWRVEGGVGAGVEHETMCMRYPRCESSRTSVTYLGSL